VAVHGPTDPALHGPYGAPEAAAVRRLPCSFCHRRMDGPRACLLGLAPEAVVERALALVAV
jgi:ADP-heptose:LPS heptosyltransferase